MKTSWKHGHGDIAIETWKHGNMETWTGDIDIETWKHGGIETWT